MASLLLFSLWLRPYLLRPVKYDHNRCRMKLKIARELQYQCFCRESVTVIRAGFNWWEAWGPVYLGGTGRLQQLYD